MHLSFQGKELILKALVQSRAIFLATVNGMPKSVEQRMLKLYQKLLWGEDKAGLMTWGKAINKKDIGGLNVPDIRSRLEAIELTWIKRWLAPKEERPAWAYVLDSILFANVRPSPKLDRQTKISWIFQTWHEAKGPQAKISPQVQYMLEVARKYNITVQAPKFSLETKERMPIWLHPLGITNNNYIVNKKAAKCLRIDHDVRTI
ncbi:hypothetical protein CPB84DRAFT_1698413, partial [Gymnopilus junonius]